MSNIGTRYIPVSPRDYRICEQTAKHAVTLTAAVAIIAMIGAVIGICVTQGSNLGSQINNLVYMVSKPPFYITLALASGFLVFDVLMISEINRIDHKNQYRTGFKKNFLEITKGSPVVQTRGINDGPKPGWWIKREDPDYFFDIQNASPPPGGLYKKFVSKELYALKLSDGTCRFLYGARAVDKEIEHLKSEGERDCFEIFEIVDRKVQVEKILDKLEDEMSRVMDVEVDGKTFFVVVRRKNGKIKIDGKILKSSQDAEIRRQYGEEDDSIPAFQIIDAESDVDYANERRRRGTILCGDRTRLSSVISVNSFSDLSNTSNSPPFFPVTYVPRHRSSCSVPTYNSKLSLPVFPPVDQSSFSSSQGETCVSEGEQFCLEMMNYGELCYWRSSTGDVLYVNECGKELPEKETFSSKDLCEGRIHELEEKGYQDSRATWNSYCGKGQFPAYFMKEAFSQSFQDVLRTPPPIENLYRLIILNISGSEVCVVKSLGNTTEFFFDVDHRDEKIRELESKGQCSYDEICACVDQEVTKGLWKTLRDKEDYIVSVGLNGRNFIVVVYRTAVGSDPCCLENLMKEVFNSKEKALKWVESNLTRDGQKVSKFPS